MDLKGRHYTKWRGDPMNFVEEDPTDLLVQDSLSQGAGKGLFVTRSFGTKEFLLNYRGDIVEEANDSVYVFDTGAPDHTLIDATLRPDCIARYINDSDWEYSDNCRPVKLKLDGKNVLAFYTIRNISKGEELRYNYRTEDAPWKVQKISEEERKVSKMSNDKSMVPETKSVVSVPQTSEAFSEEEKSMVPETKSVESVPQTIEAISEEEKSMVPEAKSVASVPQTIEAISEEEKSMVPEKKSVESVPQTIEAISEEERNVINILTDLKKTIDMPEQTCSLGNEFESFELSDFPFDVNEMSIQECLDNSDVQTSSVQQEHCTSQPEKEILDPLSDVETATLIDNEVNHQMDVTEIGPESSDNSEESFESIEVKTRNRACRKSLEECILCFKTVAKMRDHLANKHKLNDRPILKKFLSSYFSTLATKKCFQCNQCKKRMGFRYGHPEVVLTIL